MISCILELAFDASVKLLQEWSDDLDDDNSDQYKELKLEVEQTVSSFIDFLF